MKNICCIGAGYVGGPTMAVLADKCPNLEINIVDVNEAKINAWNSDDLDQLPVYEPGLAEIIKRVRNVNLFFSQNVKEEIAKADIVFISVNTPTKTSGLGAGLASDLRWVESSARDVAKYSMGHTIVVEKSTLPVKTAKVIKSILNSVNSSSCDDQLKSTFSVVSNPEFLAEGSAISDLVNPDRVLIGGDDSDAINTLVKIYENWISRDKIIVTNLWSSELSKLIANAFLAQRISAINSVSAICEETGADVQEVKIAVGSDKRIGSLFLNAGPGFGGSCFQKDIFNLIYICRHLGLKEVADFWESVVNINNWQKQRISKLIVQTLFGTVSEKKIAILGYAFKANTNDTRETPARYIALDLIDEGAKLAIHDPKVSMEKISFDLGDQKSFTKSSEKVFGSWEFAENCEKAIKSADAVVLLTDWEEYKCIDWLKMSKIMRHPAWIFDTRSILDDSSVKNTKLRVWKLGKDNSVLKDF